MGAPPANAKERNPRHMSEVRHRRSASPPRTIAAEPYPLGADRPVPAPIAVPRQDVPLATPSPSTTAELARAYNPAAYKVRLSSWKDALFVLQNRYMDSVFYLTLIIIIGQLAFFGAKTQATQAALIFWRTRDIAWVVPTFLLMVGALFLRRGRSVYLLDFATFEPPESWRVSHAELVQIIRNLSKWRATEGLCANDEADIAFQAKVLNNSGTGQATAWPPGITRCLTDGEAPHLTHQATREEAEAIIFQCLESLFARTNVQPKEVDFLIINCSLFSPTPSLCAMACHKFRFRSNLRTYNLSGQGCSASLLGIDLAAELLRSNPHSIAVVVSTELISTAFYHGHEKAMLLQNTLFRCGGAAVMLTNKASRLLQAKYRLRQLVRTQCADDDSYRAVYEQQDSEGNFGIALSKEIVKVAGNAMKINLTQLGPLILPLSEQAKVLYAIVRRKLGMVPADAPKYVPSFKAAIHFFCIHAGGRAVLDGIEKSLRLRPEDMAPSRSTLHKMGNTSSSSIWYELRYIEEHMKIARGHKVLQLAFGSGFKCNSAVWTRL